MIDITLSSVLNHHMPTAQLASVTGICTNPAKIHDG